MQGVDELELSRSITSHTFVPFLGAGASTLRRYPLDTASTPWTPVGDRLRWLWQRFNEDSPERRFVMSFAEAYGLGGVSWRDSPGSVDQFPQSSKDEGAICMLQEGLVRVASRLEGVFAEQVSTLRPAVPSAQDFRVKLSHASDEDLVATLLACVEAARSLRFDSRNPPPVPRRFLNGDLIADKLVHLGSLLLRGGPYEAKWKEQFDQEIRDLEEGFPNFAEDCGYLRLDELSWLTELLWFTLRYRIPAYPTTSELATQIALGQESVPPRTGDLALTADFYWGSPTLVDGVREWFSFCETGSKEFAAAGAGGRVGPSVLHTSLACVLHAMFEEYAREPSASVGAARYELPVAFSTNFDRELERAFDAMRFSYHTLFPVQAIVVKGGTATAKGGALTVKGPTASPKVTAANPVFFWILKTVKFTDGRRKPDRFMAVWLDSARCPIDPVGPVLVKIHGSPLEEPELVEDPDHEGKVLHLQGLRHEVVIAETAYLRNILGKLSAGPRWVSAHLKTLHGSNARHFWFLGYSVSDWNVRLLLYDRVSDSTGMPLAEQVAWRGAVMKQVDPFRRALLKNLEIWVFPEDLERFAEHLARLSIVKQYARGAV